VDTILAQLLAQPAWVVYAVVAVVILLEGAGPAGVLFPGEATALLGGATVALGRSELVPMVLVVVVAATLGDGIGFRVGTITGTRVLGSRLLRSRRDRIARLQTVWRPGVPSRWSPPAGPRSCERSSRRSPEPPGCRTAGSRRGTPSEH
jgi:membrane protein DedA with SNARE-associated domain